MVEKVAATREIFRRMLISDVRIRPVTYVSDGLGGSTMTLAAGVTVKGRIRPLLSMEFRSGRTKDSITFASDRLLTDAQWVLYVEAPQAIAKDDVIEIVGRTEQYRVVDVQEPSMAGFHLEVYLKREID